MERRRDKHAFAYLLHQTIGHRDGIMRDLDYKKAQLVNEGYCVREKQSEDKSIDLLVNNKGIPSMASRDETTLVYGKTFEVQQGVYREIKLFFSKQARKLIVCSSQIDGISIA